MTLGPQALQAVRQTASETRTVPELSTEILRTSTALLLSGPRPHSAEQLGLYDQIFARLLPQVSVDMLVELSGALATLERAPLTTVRALASHPEIRVAAPVLAKAAVLSESDLAQFIKTGTQPHLVALASRKSIPEALTDPLIARSYPAVRMALAQNLTARFSEDGYRSLFKSAERDEELAEKLGLRPDLPAKLSRAFVAAASDAARARFIKAAPTAAKATLQGTPTRSAAAAIRATWDYTQIKGEVAALARTGKLGDSAVNRFAATNDYPAVIAALALLSEGRIETIEQVMDDERIMDLLAVCKASRLSWATTSMILRGRPGCSPISAEDFDEIRRRFDKMALSEAQWKARGLQA